MSSKRSYTQYAGRPSVNPKASRTINGKVLRYHPTAPVAGSYRSRVSAQAGMRAIGLRFMPSSGELKGVDTSLSLNPILSTTNTNGSMFTLNLVVPGSGSFNRVGRKIRMASVRLNGLFRMTYGPEATTNNIAGNQIRMLLVYDRQPSGVLPTFDSMFGLTTQDGTETSTYMAPLRYDNTERFRVLRDVRVCSQVEAVNTTTGTVNSVTQVVEFDEYIKLGGLETVYSGQSSPQTIADLSSGALYVIFRCDLNAASFVTSVDPDSYARLRYYD